MNKSKKIELIAFLLNHKQELNESRLIRELELTSNCFETRSLENGWLSDDNAMKLIEWMNNLSFEIEKIKTYE